MGKKIISFSLYGNRCEYTIGAICNAELAKIIYPGWICRFYYGDSVPKEIIEELSGYDNVELVLMNEGPEYIFPMMWRFLGIDDDDVEVMISRDADARLSYREKVCVDIFMESNLSFWSVYEHGLLGLSAGEMEYTNISGRVRTHAKTQCAT
jgi:hypothetical protein